MTKHDSTSSTQTHGNRIKTFQGLMRYKVRDILLVSSLYDYYLFEEDGRLYELLRREVQTLNLRDSIEITHVTSGKDAFERLDNDIEYDLVIMTLHIEDMHVTKLAQKLRERDPKIPLILLAYDNRERRDLVANYDTSIFDQLFIWQGDYRLIIAIIKYIEDRLNVKTDTEAVGVQSIILVEDSVNFYSSYLPIIYTEIMNQSQRLITEGVNLTHRYLRMRARPKILLSTTYEEAWEYFEQYEDTILGIISDVNFKRGGMKDAEAGITFAKIVKERHDDIPILLQSSNPEFAERARAIGASFLLKSSPRLLHELRGFILDHFGFGEFIFRLPDGTEVGRAMDLKEMEEQLQIVPDASIEFHSQRNHFSNWFKARTEFDLADRLRTRKVTDFPSISDVRTELVRSIRRYIEERRLGVITEFSKETFDPYDSFARVGGGSLGGKARGLGFINTLITHSSVRERFRGVSLTVPSALVVATDVFDQFLSGNGLENFALSSTNDEELNRRFVEAEYFPDEIVWKLRDFLDVMREPLAVRSSSLLEDSQYQPFAGVYETYMIPNNHRNDEIRLQELLQSIKLIYASTFARSAKDYMKATSYRSEEEKMAVIIQRMVGARHEHRFYPDFAGVGKSYNFYPVAPQKSMDGIVSIALGLGKTVVDGGNTVRFCPKYPRHMMQFFSAKETLRNAQTDFYALDLDQSLETAEEHTPDAFVKRYDLSVAETDQTLSNVASTYSPENDAVFDGISRKGRRVVTFAPILKHNVFPLPEILEALLAMGSSGMGTPVEIEFAANLNHARGEKKEFALLQIRPLVLASEVEDIEIETFPTETILCQSTQVLGNGTIQNLYDIVVVDITTFDRSKSRETAHEVSMMNAKLVSQKRPYVLIGVGRWGSLDQWLGIPVTWDQISGAAVIVESGFKDFSVTPSQGSHFFQNITSFRVGYFTVNEMNHVGSIDWNWLACRPAVESMEFTRHIQLNEPLTVKINGHKNKGVILKPGG
ncbi:MAG TPA: PEP/pyruvate-binding domain-containing protein [Bacteroidota bacterium]|nr:PEP/pyruvate-binding domain-containing protein [Bacteroidota bacterium]